jgi:D-ribose pyranose/furanose isomerase RbsD
MSLAKFIFKGAGVGEILNSSETRTMLTSKAEAVLSAAQSSAPVDSGDYQASLDIVQATTDRAVVRVAATVPYANVVEANTGNLARALDAAG